MVNINEILRKKQELEQKLKAGKEGSIFYKFKEGDNVMRILPYKDSFYIEAYFHTLKSRMVLCLQEENCPACQAKYPLKARYFSNIVVKEENGETKNYIMGYGNMILLQLLDLITDESWGDFTGTENGYTINIKKVGEKLSTSYSIIPRVKKKVDKEEYDKWLNGAFDLDEIVVKNISYDEIVEIINNEEMKNEKRSFRKS